MKRITWIAIVCWLSMTLSVSPLLAHGGGGGHGGGGHGGGGHMGGGHMGGGHMGGGHYGGGHYGGGHYGGATYHNGGFYSNPGHMNHMNTVPMHNGTTFHHTGQAIQGTRVPTHSGITQNAFNGHHVNVGQHTVHTSHPGYQPAYYRHGQFYHGYWHNPRYYGGGWGGYGWGGFGFGFGYYPYFWGLGGWGLGSLIYSSGYCGYYNPYYNSGYGGYNYSQPIPVYYNQATNQYGQYSVHPSDMILNSAIGSFRQNNFDDALNLINQGITQYPDDAVLHEFRSLVLFAKGDYAQSAATIHSVLAVGPGWDWTTMNSIYSNVSVYTAQLRTLEGFVTQHPDDGSARFLLGYHYMTCGYPESAAKQFAKVAELVPGDKVAPALLRMANAQQTAPAASGSNTNVPNPVPQPPTTDTTPNKTPVVTIDPSTLVGDWKSSRSDDSTFALRLGSDKTFTWTFTPKGQPAVSFSGTYTLDGNVLALERTGGGSLVAQIIGNDSSKFNFKMVGAPAEDPGLNFVK